MSDDEIAGDDDIIRQHENEESDQENIDDDAVVPLGDADTTVAALDQEVNQDDEDKAKKVDPSSSKKRVTRKLIVLNTARLKGPKGVHTIEKLFEGFQFKGKGQEKEDLDRIMKRLEYWAFRLFPKLEFDDILAKCEHLGTKKDLHVHLKKYRLGMINPDDIMQDDIIEDEREDNDPIIENTGQQLLAEIANDNFQRLYNETTTNTEQNENL